jgi:hypothetical protein
MLGRGAAALDLSGHPQFLAPAPSLSPLTEETAGTDGLALGPTLLFEAWAALQSARIEAVDLHLRGGTIIHGAVRLALIGPIARASTRLDGWSHLFPVADLLMVRLVPRGGWRR